MAIPYHVFAQIAQAYGGIDPTDLDAVGAFFEAIPHRLPPARWSEVVEKLLAHEGEPLPPEYRALIEQDAARSAGGGNDEGPYFRTPFTASKTTDHAGTTCRARDDQGQYDGSGCNGH